MNNLFNKKILLIICGGISAYKSLEIIRALKKKEAQITSPVEERYNEYMKSLSDYRDKERSYIRDLDRYEQELKRPQEQEKAEARK